ncbi:MAG: glycosyl transferase family 2 [Planctomyces sp.]|nr:glycosyl transferase family 2 [Planctomyces sp.]
MRRPGTLSRLWNQFRLHFKGSRLQKWGKRVEQSLRKRRKRGQQPPEEVAIPSAIQPPPPPPPVEEEPAAPVVVEPEPAMSPQNALDYVAHLSLNAFLTSNARLAFPQFEKPTVSIVLVLFNRAELTYWCLQSCLANIRTPFEIVIYDNGSTDQTAALLDRLENVKIIRDPDNVGYVKAVNRGAEASSGEYLLLLNNDTQLTAGSIETAIEDLKANPTIGGVGARLILPSGTLQEAGSIIWSDGSALGYCRGRQIEHYEAMFERPVDYCSAAFMMLRKADFDRFDGFDEGFSPAYYEEVDFCARLAEAGLRQHYNPKIVVLHYEFGSSGSSDKALALQKRNRKRFVSRNTDYLARQYCNRTATPLEARTPTPKAKRLLFIEDRIPFTDLGSGFPRSNIMLHCMVELGYEVTLFPMANYKIDWAEAYRDLPRSVEIVQGHDCPELHQFLTERRGYYANLIISRPHNMAQLNELLTKDPELLGDTRLVYDAEAVFTMRELERLRLIGVSVSEQKRQQMLDEELHLVERADAVLTVSSGEAELFRAQGKEVHVLGHAHEIKEELLTPVSTRKGLLFVGAVHDKGSPNAKSLEWLCEDILPAMKQQSGSPADMTIAGMMLDDTQKYCRKHGCEVLGRVDDLSEVYCQARVFVAPTQFAAGIPLKIIEAAAHGVPVVATGILARQLGWNHEEQLLVADTEEEFAACCLRLLQDDQLWESIRAKALEAVARDYSREGIKRTLTASLPQTVEQASQKISA